MEIFFIQYEVVPLEKNSEYETTGGAVVNCWIKASSLNEADKIAAKVIEADHWKIINTESFSVNESFYEDDEDGAEYYRQAMVDGECYVYYSWPNEAQEEDFIH